MFYPDQAPTPINQPFAAETVTVTDPRHPLCGRTLRLIGVTNKQYLGRCCVVWLRPDVERLVPVEATDLECDSRALHPNPLSLDSLKALLRVFEQIQHSNVEVTENAPRSSIARSTSCERDERH